MAWDFLNLNYYICLLAPPRNDSFHAIFFIAKGFNSFSTFQYGVCLCATEVYYLLISPSSLLKAPSKSTSVFSLVIAVDLM